MQYAPPVHQESYLETERREITPGISIRNKFALKPSSHCLTFALIFINTIVSQY